MEIVYKYQLGIGLNRMDLPAGAQPLHVGHQGDLLQMWMRCNPIAAVSRRLFWVVGTGQQFDRQATYIGTIQVPPHGYLSEMVWHVFEEAGE
jgi:hypothetical protein